MKKAFYLLILLFACIACNTQSKEGREKGYDLPQVRDSGELVALTLYSSTSYFIYRGGEAMGFQYELGEQFAQSLGVKLRIKVANSTSELFQMLMDKEGDIITYPLPVTKTRRDSLLFCGEEVVTHQVIVQQSNGKNKPLKDVTELIGKEVHVKPGRYYHRLINLNEELGGGIIIHKVNADSVSMEDLITQVSRGDILYTVCDNDVAQLNKTYYPNLDISLSISYDQLSSWAVRKDSLMLAEAANKWNEANQTSSAYNASMKRYFEISKAAPSINILSIQEGKISVYDDLFKKYAPEIGWDWRLLAALAYQESNFDPDVTSWAGARGLMQLMPSTARAMGVPPGMEDNPEESIKGAINYITATSRSLRMIQDDKERINFILGAYNAGLGHIYDAMALAEKYGKNKYIWEDNVEEFILLKNNEEYYNDPVVKNGYFRGTETYNFVRDINARFELYKMKIKS